MMINKQLLRRMGYSSDSQGIIDRYINVNGAWESHLLNCRQFIVDCVQKRKIEKLAVFGSGWLLDFPLDEMASSVGHIWLFDIVHPPQIIQKINRLGNVTAETVDLTGGILNQAYQAVEVYKKNRALPDYQKWGDFRFKWAHSFDYAISLNLLSQIGELITNYLSQHIPVDEKETESITGIIQESHLQVLEPQKSCIITDTLEKVMDKNQHIQKYRNLVHCPFPIPGHARKWEWHFDPLMEYHPGYQTVSDVVAFEL